MVKATESIEADRDDIAGKYKAEMEIRNILQTKLHAKERDFEHLAVSLKKTLNRMDDLSDSESFFRAELIAEQNICDELRQENRCREEKVSNSSSTLLRYGSAYGMVR